MKVDKNVEKTNSRIFQFNFESFLFAITGKLFCTKILYVQHPTLQLNNLFFSLLLRRYHVFKP